MAQTIIVSNRLPVSIKKGEHGLEVYPSAGGLATGLATFANKKNNLWIGWPGISLDEITEDERLEITEKLAAYNCRPVYLTKKQLDDFYTGYSNSLLWPFLHTLEADFRNEARLWRAYQEVNELFAEAVLSLSKPGSTIWVHDYQLLLLPRLLREHRPHDDIGFFLHIPFPAAEHFRTLKAAPAIIRGMLGADLVGFHTKEYVQGFLDSCLLLTSAAPTKNGVALKERAVRVADFPLGIDYLKFSRANKTRAVRKEVRRLRRKYRRYKTILTVDRLDPTKGFLERLDAYRTLLKQEPAMRGKVKMIMLAIPSRGDVEAYKKLKTDVEKRVKNINRTFGTPRWQPIDYIYDNLPFEKFSALYQFADVAFVTPVKDGMNLVAKEYVASQGRRKGMLILSEKAGAAQELRDALLVDPANPRTLVAALSKAVTMPRRELKQRVKAMQQVLSANTVHTWANSFMKALRSPLLRQRTPHLNTLRRLNLLRNYQSARSRLIIFDYDGVLTPFTGKPQEARPSKELLSSLQCIGKKPNTTLAIVSGRSKEDIGGWFSKLPATLAAEHGAVLRRKGNQTWKVLTTSPRPWKKEIMPLLQHEAEAAPGAFVEEKDYSLVWHYRNVAGVYYAQRGIARIKTALKPVLKRHGLKLFRGDMILEVKDPSLNKGEAIKALLDKPYEFILALGDDFTDEDMFKALPRRAFTVKVGPGRTNARYRLKNVTEVQNLLRSM